MAEDNKEGHFRYFLQNLSLNKFNNCLVASVYLDSPAIYESLGRRALAFVELDVALKAFQLAKNLSMVLMIQSFIDQTEKNLIFGNVAMILG
jgi:WD repeat-containing protein 19